MPGTWSENGTCWSTNTVSLYQVRCLNLLFPDSHSTSQDDIDVHICGVVETFIETRYFFGGVSNPMIEKAMCSVRISVVTCSNSKVVRHHLHSTIKIHSKLFGSISAWPPSILPSQPCFRPWCHVQPLPTIDKPKKQWVHQTKHPSLGDAPGFCGLAVSEAKSMGFCGRTVWGGRWSRSQGTLKRCIWSFSHLKELFWGYTPYFQTQPCVVFQYSCQ